MAYLTFDPSSRAMEFMLGSHWERIVQVLSDGLIQLGVAKDDIVIRFLNCHTVFSTSEHVEVVLKTDNPSVTAEEIVSIVSPTLGVNRFEISRIYVGDEGNWASNY